jgi:hypothetical protein
LLQNPRLRARFRRDVGAVDPVGAGPALSDAINPRPRRRRLVRLTLGRQVNGNAATSTAT